MKNKIIVLSGKAQSGKDFTAKLFQYYLDDSLKKTTFSEFKEQIFDNPMFGQFIRPNFEIKRFADKLKEVCSNILNVPRWKYEMLDFKQSKIGGIYKDLTYREFLNKFADLSYSLNQNIWSNALFESFEKNKNYIIPDLRFKHELEDCKKYKLQNDNCFLIRIKSQNYLEHNHISEIDLDDVQDSEFDFIIDNSEKNLEKLENQILDIIKIIKK
jgi:hypothetical protein